MQIIEESKDKQHKVPTVSDMKIGDVFSVRDYDVEEDEGPYSGTALMRIDSQLKVPPKNSKKKPKKVSIPCVILENGEMCYVDADDEVKEYEAILKITERR